MRLFLNNTEFKYKTHVCYFTRMGSHIGYSKCYLLTILEIKEKPHETSRAELTHSWNKLQYSLYQFMLHK